MDVGRLIEAGRVKKMICAFTAAPHPSQALTFEKLHESGEIEAELVPQGTLAERIRAAAAGIGAFYTPTGVGTEVAQGKEHRVINGREYLLEHPCPPTTPSSGPTGRTPGATCNTAYPNATSIPSWPRPPG